MKTFEEGQLVEVKPGPGEAWEPATYVRLVGMRSRESYHRALLKRERWFNPFIGMESSAADKRALKTAHVIVPARRIRVRHG